MIIDHPFAIINVISLILLGISFLLVYKLIKLMGRGKDTQTTQLLIIVIIVNILLGLLQLIGGYLKYMQNFWAYIQLTDIVLLISGIILVTATYRVYKNYKDLVKRNEPEE